MNRDEEGIGGHEHNPAPLPRRCRDCMRVARNSDGTAWEDTITGQGMCRHESHDDVDLDKIRDSEDCNAFHRLGVLLETSGEVKE